MYPDVRQSLLSARPLSSTTGHNSIRSKCYIITDEEGNNIDEGTEIDEYLIENAKNIPIYYQVQSILPNADCVYQISLQHFTNSIITILEGVSEPFSLKYQETTYFLYRHRSE